MHELAASCWYQSFTYCEQANKVHSYKGVLQASVSKDWVPVSDYVCINILISLHTILALMQIDNMATKYDTVFASSTACCPVINLQGLPAH